MNMGIGDTERWYAKYISETASTVTILEDARYKTLQRCRMYNSYIDTKGFLYTEYAERDYVEGAADKKAANSKRSEGTKRGWENRKRNKPRVVE